MKNISDLHENDKGVSAKSIFKSSLGGNATSIQLLRNQSLKEHSSKIDALLICIEGKVLYEDEEDNKHELFPGDFLDIKAGVKHWLESPMDSQLLLLK
ncbi:cupin domain-containing protein [Marivirga sp.]|uniref:cupin domain-containing protein n=1 Tax=Marivirga sp. TaxID=2018662 RepID=UPI003DA6E4E6